VRIATIAILYVCSDNAEKSSGGRRSEIMQRRVPAQLAKRSARPSGVSDIMAEPVPR
jgi:hypothetical protein